MSIQATTCSIATPKHAAEHSDLPSDVCEFCVRLSIAFQYLFAVFTIDLIYTCVCIMGKLNLYGIYISISIFTLVFNSRWVED